MQTAVLAALQYTARNAPEMMRNFWRRGENARPQGTPGEAVRLRRARAAGPTVAAWRSSSTCCAGTASRSPAPRRHSRSRRASTRPARFVVRLDQPYRGFALDLLTPQKYPADKAPYAAYDDVAWALPVSLGVEVKAIGDEAVKTVAVAPVTENVVLRAEAPAAGAYYLLADSGQEALLEARVRLSRFKVEAAEAKFTSDGRDYPAGSWILADQPGLEAALGSVAANLALRFDTAAAAPAVARHALDLPRLAVLQTWTSTQSAGWVRMIFDDQKVPYTLIMDEDVRKGGLRSRFDVILYPETDGSLRRIVGGIDPKFGPLAYTKTAEFPSHGTPTASSDITGGITWAGLGQHRHVRARGRRAGHARRRRPRFLSTAASCAT